MIACLAITIALLVQSDDPVGQERADFIKLAEASIKRLDPEVRSGSLLRVSAMNLKQGSVITVSYLNLSLTFDRSSKEWVGYSNISRSGAKRGPTPPPLPSVNTVLGWVEGARIAMEHPYPYVACDYVLAPYVERTEDPERTEGPYTFGIAVQPVRDGIRYKQARYATFFADPLGQLIGFTVALDAYQDPDPKQVRKLSPEQAEDLALAAARKAIPNFGARTIRKAKPDRLEYVNQKSGKARLAHFFGYRYDPSNVSKDWSNYLIWIDVETGAVLAEDHIFEQD